MFFWCVMTWSNKGETWYKNQKTGASKAHRSHRNFFNNNFTNEKSTELKDVRAILFYTGNFTYN